MELLDQFQILNAPKNVRRSTYHFAQLCSIYDKYSTFRKNEDKA